MGFRIGAALPLKGVVIEIYGYSQLKPYRQKTIIDLKLKENSITTDSFFYRLTDTCPGPDSAILTLFKVKTKCTIWSNCLFIAKDRNSGVREDISLLTFAL